MVRVKFHPKAERVIVPNHVSNIDPVLLGVAVSRVRPLRALAKESLFRLPVVGNVLSKMGHIPVHRGTAQGGESLATALEAIQEGRLVALYPEGTIPANHVRLGKGKTGAARLALATGAPVIPVGQWGAQHVMPLRKNPLISIVRSAFTRPRVTVSIGEPVKWSVWDGNPIESIKDQPQQLVVSMTEDIMLAISQQLESLGK